MRWCYVRRAQASALRRAGAAGTSKPTSWRPRCTRRGSTSSGSSASSKIAVGSRWVRLLGGGWSSHLPACCDSGWCRVVMGGGAWVGGVCAGEWAGKMEGGTEAWMEGGRGEGWRESADVQMSGGWVRPTSRAGLQVSGRRGSRCLMLVLTALSHREFIDSNKRVSLYSHHFCAKRG